MSEGKAGAATCQARRVDARGLVHRRRCVFEVARGVCGVVVGRFVEEDAAHEEAAVGWVGRPFGVRAHVGEDVVEGPAAVVDADVAERAHVGLRVQAGDLADVAGVWPPGGRAGAAVGVEDDDEVQVGVRADAVARGAGGDGQPDGMKNVSGTGSLSGQAYALCKGAHVSSVKG